MFKVLLGIKKPWVALLAGICIGLFVPSAQCDALENGAALALAIYLLMALYCYVDWLESL